jgi:hypothetical protein
MQNIQNKGLTDKIFNLKEMATKVVSIFHFDWICSIAGQVWGLLEICLPRAGGIAPVGERSEHRSKGAKQATTRTEADPLRDDNQKNSSKTGDGKNRSRSPSGMTTQKDHSKNKQRQEHKASTTRTKITAGTRNGRTDRVDGQLAGRAGARLVRRRVLQEAKYVHASCGRGECGSRGT